MKIVSKLHPLTEATLVNIYEKLLSHLTHMWVEYDHTGDTESWAGLARGEYSSNTVDKDHWADMKPAGAEKLFLFFHKLQEEIEAKHRGKTEGF